jgi:hypothetical protein
LVRTPQCSAVGWGESVKGLHGRLEKEGLYFSHFHLKDAGSERTRCIWCHILAISEMRTDQVDVEGSGGNLISVGGVCIEHSVSSGPSYRTRTRLLRRVVPLPVGLLM